MVQRNPPAHLLAGAVLLQDYPALGGNVSMHRALYWRPKNWEKQVMEIYKRNDEFK